MTINVIILGNIYLNCHCNVAATVHTLEKNRLHSLTTHCNIVMTLISNCINCINYTPSDRIAMHLPRVLEVPRWEYSDLWPTFAPCKWRSVGTALYGYGENDQSSGSTISDDIIRSCQWSTATRSCPLDYFSFITASS